MVKPAFEMLSEWRLYLTNISSNLMELSDEMEYQIIKLKAKDPINGYTGITKTKAEQCIDSMGSLWRYFALLSEVVEKANELYKRNSFLNNTEDEVREILETATIVIETERIAISERNLLSGENKEKKTTPVELLQYMQECFENISSTVAEIFKASETVDIRINNIKLEIASLILSARRLGITSIPAFDAYELTEAERDPLQGILDLEKLVYRIEKFRASIQASEKDYSRASEALNRVRNMLAELKDLAEKSKEAAFNTERLFGSRQWLKPVIGEDILKSLEDWLKVLENKLSQGSLDAVKIGVYRLEQECILKLKIENENYFENSRNYNEWLDLKGHFKALCAKSEILKEKGVVLDISLKEQMGSVEAALYASTVNLENCRKLVRKFELSLKSR